jgi:predicted aspartyl protease
MARHNTAQEKGKMTSWPRWIGARTRTKVIRFVERCGQKGKGGQVPEINGPPLTKEGKEKEQEMRRDLERVGEEGKKEQQAAFEAWRHLILVLCFFHHHQRLFLACQVQQSLLYFLCQQYMSAKTPSSGIQTPNTPSETVPTPSVLPQMAGVVHPLPLPGAPGAPPTFNGRDVSSFLKKYESMCDNYQIEGPERLRRVSGYCEDDIARELEAFTTWEEKDWGKLKAEMMREWRKEDTEQLMYTRAFLEEYVNKPRSKEGLKHYYRQFDRISKALMAKEELDSYSQGWLFMTGLPEAVRYKILSQQDDSSNALSGPVNYLAALKIVKRVVEAEEAAERYRVRPERQTEISDLASSLNESKPPATGIQGKLSNTTERKDRQKEDAVDMITKSLSALTLPLTAAVDKMEAAVTMMSSMKPIDTPGPGLDPALDKRQGRPFRSFTCFFCEEPGHVKPKCPHFNRLLSSESIHVNSEGRIALGPRREGAMPIWRVPGMTMLQAVERQVNMRGTSTSAEFGIIRADLDEDSDVEISDNRYGPTSVDAFGARADVQKGKRPIRSAVTDPVKDARTRATKQTAQKQNQYPVMKSLRTGVWEPPEGETIEVIPDSSKDGSMEVEQSVPDAPTAKAAKVPKTSLKKLLAGHADPMSVIDRMLQQPLTISWAEALSLSGDLRKFMFGTFNDPKASSEKAVEAQINKMRAEIEDEEEHASEALDKATEPYYIAASPMVNVNIGQKRVPALLDSGAEVTVMTADLAWSLGLPISQSFNVNMSAATGKSKKFIGLCEDVAITVGKITHKVPVWVIDKLEHGLVLGRTYHKAAGLKLEEMDDGSCSATIFTPDRTAMVRWQAVSPRAKRNQLREDLLSKHALNSQAEA